MGVQKRILALDVGEKRTGVALSDPMGIVARPLTVLQRASHQADLEAIEALVAEHEVGQVLVGLPLTLRGERGPQAQQVMGYAERLSAGLSVPVLMWDERYSTAEAEALMEAKGQRGRKGKDELDAVAAAVFLQSYLNSQASPAGGSGTEVGRMDEEEWER